MLTVRSNSCNLSIYFTELLQETNLSNSGNSKSKVVALLSGGLDSSLAVLLMCRQDVEVHAIVYMTHFGCHIAEDKSGCSHDPFPMAEKYGFDVKMCHLGEKYIEIVKNPKFGHGKNMNPCVDCRIMMLNEAKYVMERIGADAIVTGEVLGQRPMSQTRDRLFQVEKETGLKGRLLRPLSAKLMDPTVPELEGKIDRDRLEGISGRSRRRQMELAEELGLEEYPNATSGCLLTDPNFSRRLKDLFTHTPDAGYSEINLLKVGRHFRYSADTKIIVGRNESDNDQIEALKSRADIQLEAKDTGSPITLLQGMPTDDAVEFAARITARYCDDKRARSVPITMSYRDREEVVEVAPLEDSVLKKIRL